MKGITTFGIEVGGYAFCTVGWNPFDFNLYEIGQIILILISI